MRDAFADFGALMADFDRRGLFHVELGLTRMRRSLLALGLSRAPFFMAQILGTNGKGSTAAFFDSLARAHGLRCGLYVSPHFLSPLERIQIDGAQAVEAEWLWAANRIAREAPDFSSLTYFEFATLVAMLIFARRGVDLAVIEAGLGGENDATSALPVAMHVFAPIGVDHEKVIGPTLEDIARDKASAIRKGAAVYSAPQTPAPEKILRAAAAAANSAPVFAPPLPPEAPLGLFGAHQKTNAGLALAAFAFAASRLGVRLDDAASRRGLRAAFIPGRLQRAEDDLLLDGAHNPHAFAKILPEARKIMGGEIAIIFSALAEKDWPQMIRLLQAHFPAARYFTPQLANPRAADARALAAALNELSPGRAAACAGVGEALKAAGAPALALGSLYLLAEIYALRPQYLKRPHLSEIA